MSNEYQNEWLMLQYLINQVGDHSSPIFFIFIISSFDIFFQLDYVVSCYSQTINVWLKKKLNEINISFSTRLK